MSSVEYQAVRESRLHSRPVDFGTILSESYQTNTGVVALDSHAKIMESCEKISRIASQAAEQSRFEVVTSDFPNKMCGNGPPYIYYGTNIFV